MQLSVDIADLLATLKVVALFCVSHHCDSRRSALWSELPQDCGPLRGVVHVSARTYPVWRRWLIRRVTPLTVRASGIFLALGVAIVTALLAGGFYPPALGFALAFAAACGLLFFIMIFVFYFVEARQPHPPTSPTARLFGNVLTALALILVAWILFSIVQDCLSSTGCR